jgi:hypothetical protein
MGTDTSTGMVRSSAISLLYHFVGLWFYGKLIACLDYTLGHFLRGVVQFTARYQPSDASESAKTRSEGEPSDEEIDEGAERDFNLVLEHAPRVEVSLNPRPWSLHPSPRIYPNPAVSFGWDQD